MAFNFQFSGHGQGSNAAANGIFPEDGWNPDGTVNSITDGGDSGFFGGGSWAQPQNALDNISPAKKAKFEEPGKGYPLPAAPLLSGHQNVSSQSQQPSAYSVVEKKNSDCQQILPESPGEFKVPVTAAVVKAAKVNGSVGKQDSLMLATSPETSTAHKAQVTEDLGREQTMASVTSSGSKPIPVGGGKATMATLIPEDKLSECFLVLLKSQNEELAMMEPVMKEQEEKMDSIICKVDLMLQDMDNYEGRLESLKNMYRAKVSAMTSIFKVKQEPASS